MRYVSRVMLCAALLLLGTTTIGGRPPALASDVDDRVLAALLREDWPAVVDLIGDAAPAASAAVRAVKAHALLAMNRNNESVCLFRGLAASADLEAWHAWARGWSTQHADRPIAQYLAGDALARLGRPEEAASAFGRALVLDPGHVLSLNARGVVRATQGNLPDALDDLHEAIRLRPDLADAHANRGTLWMQQGEAAAGAIRAFDGALRWSPDFVLALHGGGTLRILTGKYAEAETRLKAAARPGCLGDLVAHDLVRLMDAINSPSRVASADDGDPGTTIDRNYRSMMNDPTRESVNSFVVSARDNPLQGEYVQKFSDAMAKDAALAKRFEPFVRNGTITNEIAVQGFSALAGVETTIGGSLGLKGGVNKAGREIGGEIGGHAEVKYNFAPLAESQLEKSKGHLDVFRGMERGLAPDNTGGITSDTSAALIDAGDWKLQAHYGLFYSSPVSATASGSSAR